MRIKVFVIFLVFSCFGAQAQEWVTLYSQAEKQHADENYLAAIETGERCLQKYLNQHGALNNNYATILRLLTTACYAQGEYEKGITYGEKELMVRDHMANAEDLTYAGTLYNLGSLHFMLEQYDDAAPLIARTLAIYAGYYPEGHEEIVACQWKFASIKSQQGQLEVAGNIFRKSFEAYGEPDEVSMDYLSACYDYGMLLLGQEDFQEAGNYLEKVKLIYEASGYESSINNANVLNNLASCRSHSGKYREAVSYYTRALAIYEAADGDHTRTIQKIQNDQAVCLQALGRNDEAEQLLSSIDAGSDEANVSSMINLAVLSQEKNDYEKAEELFKKAQSQLSDSSKTYAEITEKLGVLHTITGKYEAAEDQFAQAEEGIVSAFGRDGLRYASMLTKKAVLQKEQRNYGEAKNLYKQAKEIYEKTAGASDNKYASLLNGLGAIHQEEGDYLQAEAFFRKSLDLIRDNSGTNSSDYATVLNNLAILLQLKGHLLEAEDLLKTVAATIKTQPDFNKSSYAVALDNLGALHIQTGDFNAAARHLSESLRLKEAIYGKKHPLYGSGLLNLARLEQAKGQYSEAEPLYKEVITLQKQVLGENHPGYANALNGMALLYQTMGNFKEAEPLWIEARAIYKSVYGKMHPEYATTLQNLATLYQLQGNHTKALPLLEEALKIDEAIFGHEHPTYGTTLHNIASLYQDLDRYEEAEPLYLQALNIDAKTFGKKHPSYASTLYNIAILKQDLKKYDEAEILFKEAISIRREILGAEHPDYAYSLYGLGALYHATHKGVEAEKLYSEAVNHYLDQIQDFFPSLSEREKSAFYTKIKPVFEAYQDFAVEYALSADEEQVGKMLSTLYDLQLSTKALLLNASNKIRNRILSSGDKNLISTYHEWINGKEKLVKLYTYTKEELHKENIDLTQFEQHLNELEKSLSAKSTLFAMEFEKASFTWHDVQQELKEDEAAVEILRVKKKLIADSVMYVALIIKKGDSVAHPQLVVMNQGNRLESRTFNYYQNAIKFSIGDNFSYTNYWEPIKNALSGVNLAYISSDGIYNKISFNTLWNNDNKTYLIDEIDLKLVSNTKEIIVDHHNATGTTAENGLLFGYPDFDVTNEAVFSSASIIRATAYGFTEGGIPALPGTKTEIEKLNALLEKKDWSIKTYMKEMATEENLKLVDSPVLLHIATHGYFMSDLDTDTHELGAFGVHFNNSNANPLFRSGLLLTGASEYIYKDKLSSEQEDGILTAYEAMNLNLDNTELVVLSACETGMGEIKNGEGVYGLQRAFVVAGAKTVIMSLWQVDDETTQQLMTFFYEFWLNGNHKLEAFKKAQLKLKKLHNDPYHWGAFIILGN